VNEAVRYFKQLGRGKHILPIVVAGEPNASDGNKPGRSPEDECFVPRFVTRYRRMERWIPPGGRANPFLWTPGMALINGKFWPASTAPRKLIWRWQNPADRLAARSRVQWIMVA